MPLVVPNPTVPTNGQPLDATPLLANLNAVYQAIQSFDGSQIQAGSILASAFNASINPNTLLKETGSGFVYSGLVWSTVSGLSVGMTAGTAYVQSSTQGFRVSVLAVASTTLTASKDVYIDVDVNGNLTYTSVTNGATSPALTANSIRLAVIVTGASSITSIRQYGVDNIGTSIYPQGAIGGNNMDWDRFFVSAKSATNSGNISPGNTDNNLNSNGVGVTFVTTAPCVALVTVSIGANSTTDFEFQPEILLNGGLAQRFQPSAAAGNTSNRGSVRGFSAIVQLPTPGTNVLSAGVTFASGTALAIPPTGATISAVVFGKVSS